MAGTGRRISTPFYHNLPPIARRIVLNKLEGPSVSFAMSSPPALDGYTRLGDRTLWTKLVETCEIDYSPTPRLNASLLRSCETLLLSGAHCATTDVPIVGGRKED